VSDPPIALRLARFALDVDFAALPESMVEWGKEVLLDTIGCAISGYDGAPAESARRVFAALGGAAQSTVIGSGQRLPSPAAAWINGTMARYQDLNDTHPQPGRVGHFSEVIPTALAVAEQSGAGGARLLAAIVAGYEVLAATTFHGPQVGVGFATFGAIASPVVAGTLLGLSERQIASAVGISLSSNVTLVSWLGEAGGSMLKASTWSSNAHHGILAAMLAQQGFTAPETAIETYLRTVEVSHPEVQLPPPGRFTAPARNMLKRYAAQMSTAGPIELVLTLARRHQIRPEDVEEIVVHGTAELARYAAGPGTQRPASREAADHSLPYVLAVALVEGDVLPAQYARRQWEEPRVVTLMDKVTSVVSPELDRRAHADGSMPARVVIRAAGRTFSAELENPRGHAANPMSAVEVRDKFRRLVSSRLSADRQDAVIRAVADIDKAAAVTDLLTATVFDIKPPSV
jgi:2-methylcitrate dehydratase